MSIRQKFATSGSTSTTSSETGATAAGKTEVAADRVWGMRGAIGFLTFDYTFELKIQSQKIEHRVPLLPNPPIP